MWPDFSQHPRMIRIQPVPFLTIQQRRIDQFGVERREGDRLEPQERLYRANQIGRLHKQQIFHPDAVMAGQVVSWLT